MPKQRVIWETSDGSEFDTETEALAHEERLRVKKQVALAISVADSRRAKSGNKRLVYNSSSLTTIIEGVLLMHRYLGSELLMEIVSGGLSEERQQKLRNEIAARGADDTANTVNMETA